MKFTYNKYPPSEVIPFYTPRELTEEEKERGLTLNEYGNISTGNEFIDQFAALIRKIRWGTHGDYARATGIDIRLLNATIQTLTGQAIYEWVEYYTLLGAYEMLRDTDKEIKEISKQLGFSQVSIFSRFCKNRTKQPPKELRYSLRRKAKQ